MKKLHYFKINKFVYVVLVLMIAGFVNLSIAQEVSIDGFQRTKADIVEFDGISSVPSKSASGKARIYYDSLENKLKQSVNNGNYADFGNTTPSGSDTQVQFNNGGAFGGDSGMTYNSGTDTLTVTGAVDSGDFTCTECLTLGSEVKAGTLTDTKLCTWDDANSQVVCNSDAGAGNVQVSGTPNQDYVTTWSNSTTIQEGPIKFGIMTDTKNCIYTATNDSVTCNSDLTISGTDRQVMFFNGDNTPAGDSGMTYNATTDSLTVVGTVSAAVLESTGAGQSTTDEGLAVNTDGGSTEAHDFVVNTDTVNSALECDAGDNTCTFKVPIYIEERADADSDIAGLGQLWVNTATPNELFFTDDDGTDFQLGVETNSLETTITGITDTEIFIGDGSDSGVFVAMSGDATMDSTGAITISNDSIEESMFKVVDSASDEECLTYESTTGDFEWQSCGGSSEWTDNGSYLEPNTDGDGIQVNDSGGTDYCTQSHDGTDYNIACTNTTEVSLDTQFRVSSSTNSRSIFLENSNPRIHEIKSDYAYLKLNDVTGGITYLSMANTNFTINPNNANMDVKIDGDTTDDIVVVDAGAETATFHIAFIGEFETSDPCGDSTAFPEGSVFYNDTSNYYCYCDGTNDVQLHDPSTACF